MITVKELDKEIAELMESARIEEKPSKKKRLIEQASILKTCKMYIESNPDADFIVKEKERVNTRINLIMDGYSEYTSAERNEKKRLSEYKKLYGISQLKKQLKILSMIGK